MSSRQATRVFIVTVTKLDECSWTPPYPVSSTSILAEWSVLAVRQHGENQGCALSVKRKTLIRQLEAS